MNPDNPRQLFLNIKAYLRWGVVVWSIIIVASLFWNIFYTKNQTMAKADVMAHLAFEKDFAFRNWVTFHGGVYVPVTGETPSNPYLNVPEKDVTLKSGKPFTLMNPAYVMRQYYENIYTKEGVQGHITSLKPLRPENKPDLWEEQSLLSFANGKKEATIIQTLGDTEYVRLIKPLVTAKGCLKCHAQQGYKEGEIRGGISVSVPMAPLRHLEKNQIIMLSGFHAILWLLGFAGIFLFGKRLIKTENERSQADEALRETNLALAQAYKELREEQDIIIQQSKMASIGVLAAGVAHEIKNPLAIMLQGISYLQSTGGNDSMQTEILTRLNTAVLRTDKIVKGLISYASQNPLTLDKQDILEIIEESLTLTEHELGKKNLQLIKHYAPDLPPISVDGNQINQVFVSVLLNGIDSMSPGGIFTIDVRQTADDAGKKFLEVTFKDTGHGIPTDTIDKIFDPFYTTKPVGSTGLGLSVSKGIIDKHGGTIHAESQVEHGTSIIIKLPVSL